jgi:hypothetical protein
MRVAFLGDQSTEPCVIWTFLLHLLRLMLVGHTLQMDQVSEESRSTP